MAELEAGETGVQHPGHQRRREGARAPGRVGEDRHSPGCHDEPDSRHRVGREEGDVVGAPGAEDAAEGLITIAHVPPSDERVGDVRATNGSSVGGLLEDVLPLEVEVSGDPVRDHPGPVEARGPHPLGHRPQVLVVGVEQVGEHMNAAPVIARRHLHARHEHHAEGRGCLGGLTPTRGGVVIGQGGDAQAVTMRCPHDVSWRVCPV